MGKYVLNYADLDFNLGVSGIEFTSASKRANFIADKVIGSKPDRVFLLAIERCNEYDSIYIFDKWQCIEDVVESRFKDFYLFEYESYEDAYRNALDMKEKSELCYNNIE